MWSCDVCGTTGVAAEDACPSCGRRWVPEVLILRPDDGAPQQLRTGCPLNRAWARHVVGDSSRYWDACLQLSIVRDEHGWFVEPNLLARNETLLDGCTVSVRTRLRAGMVLAVGRESSKVAIGGMRVEL